MLKLLKYLAPYKTSVALVLTLVFLQSLSELFLPTILAEIVDIGIVKGDTPFIVKMGGVMLLVTALGAGCSVLASYLSAKTATGFGKILRKRVFSQVETFSLHEMDQLGTATLITRTTNDVTQIQQVLIMILRMMVSAPLMLIGGIIMAVSKDAKLSQIFFLALPAIAFTIYLIASKGIPLFKAIQVKLDKLNLVLRESLTGIRVIRAFNRTEYEKKRYNKANLDLTDTTVRVNRIMAAMMPTMMLIMNLTTVSIIWFGGIRIDQGHMQVGDLMAFIQYAMQIMFSLLMLSMMFVMIPRASVSAIRINEVLDTQSGIQDHDFVEHAKNKCSENESGTDEDNNLETGKERNLINELKFENVAFQYPGAESAAVSRISFTAKPGKATAIIGGTGSGKSTILKLLLRFYDVNEGCISVNGVDIRKMLLRDLRKKIGYVPQKAVLFTGTIEDNIRYGKKEAEKEDVLQAAEIAQASEFITEMEGNFAAQIAQGGLNLSGGQKQRVSIARALVGKPEIYVFDDSFSALDYKTDARLRMALKKETKEAIMIIVAQRVSTVRNADQIIVLDDGRIVGIGTHKDLMQTCEVYQEIAASQLSEEELA